LSDSFELGREVYPVDETITELLTLSVQLAAWLVVNDPSV
jgi:hypothetical protein